MAVAEIRHGLSLPVPRERDQRGVGRAQDRLPEHIDAMILRRDVSFMIIHNKNNILGMAYRDAPSL